MENHCQKDQTSPVTPRQVPPLIEDVEPPGQPEPKEPSFIEVTKATPAQPKKGARPWLGPVADTVLADFAFYGLLAGVPVLFLWAFFGYWWVFRNAEWIGLGLLFWFVVLVAWRRRGG